MIKVPSNYVLGFGGSPSPRYLVKMNEIIRYNSIHFEERRVETVVGKG